MSNIPTQQPVYQPSMRKLNQSRALWKLIVFSIITCGIYAIVMWSGIGEDLNMAASRRVEIKFRLKEDEMIEKIAQILNQGQ